MVPEPQRQGGAGGSGSDDAHVRRELPSVVEGSGVDEPGGQGSREAVVGGPGGHDLGRHVCSPPERANGAATRPAVRSSAPRAGATRSRSAKCIVRLSSMASTAG